MSHCAQCLALELELNEALNKIKQLEAELKEVKLTNPLTNIPNKLALEKAVQKAQADKERYNRDSFIFYLDLDNFKELNDNYSHEVGNDVLCHVATILNKTIRGNDTVFHISGDEFAVIAETKDPKKVKDSLIHALAKIEVPYKDSFITNIAGSVGFTPISIIETVRQTFENADYALQMEKERRLNVGLRHKR